MTRDDAVEAAQMNRVVESELGDVEQEQRNVARSTPRQRDNHIVRSADDNLIAMNVRHEHLQAPATLRVRCWPRTAR